MNEENTSYPPKLILKQIPSVAIGLCIMNCRTVTLNKGTLVARLSPTNRIPDMLAPKLENCQP